MKRVLSCILALAAYAMPAQSHIHRKHIPNVTSPMSRGESLSTVIRNDQPTNQTLHLVTYYGCSSPASDVKYYPLALARNDLMYVCDLKTQKCQERQTAAFEKQLRDKEDTCVTLWRVDNGKLADFLLKFKSIQDPKRMYTQRSLDSFFFEGGGREITLGFTPSLFSSPNTFPLYSESKQ